LLRGAYLLTVWDIVRGNIHVNTKENIQCITEIIALIVMKLLTNNPTHRRAELFFATNGFGV
jgi:transcriptional regulator of met regulon